MKNCFDLEKMRNLFIEKMYFKIIVINALIYLAFSLGISMVEYFSLYPDLSEFIFSPWTILTFMFFHESFLFLFINMLLLFFFGSELEKIISSKKILTIYVVSSIVGGLVILLLSPLVYLSYPINGAAISVFAIIGTLAWLRPELNIFGVNITQIVFVSAVLNVITFLTMFQTSGLSSISNLAGLGIGIYYGRIFEKQTKK